MAGFVIATAVNAMVDSDNQHDLTMYQNYATGLGSQKKHGTA
jgi:hypothetical protein